MLYDMILPLLQNTILLLAIAMTYYVFPYQRRYSSFLRKFLVGLIVGTIGIAVMSNPFVFGNGISFDTRSILITTAGMFLGFIPTVTAGVILVAYRLYLGGAGAITGSMVVVITMSLGLLWRKYRLGKDEDLNKFISPYELLGFGYIVHIVVLLLMYTLPNNLGQKVVDGVWLSMITVYPIGFLLLSLLFINQRKRTFMNEKMESSENQYRALFQSSKTVLMLLEPHNGNIVDINKTGLFFYGWSREEMLKMSIKEINILKGEDLQKEIDRCARLEKSFFNFKHRLANGEIRDVEVHSGPILINEKTLLLSTIIDVTNRIKMEKSLKTQQEQITYISNHDYLTGLYNRYFFEVELNRLNTRRQLPISIIMGDANSLKLINDTFGHLAGDDLLISITKILKDTFRSEDIVARWGGDEFIILLPKTSSDVAEQIIDRIKERCVISDENVISPSISLGYSTKTTEETDIYLSLTKAEEMMYKNKASESEKVKTEILFSINKYLSENNDNFANELTEATALAKDFGKATGLDNNTTKDLLLAVKHHHIGVVNFPRSIFTKKNDLTQEEWEKIKSHPTVGSRLIQSFPNLSHLHNYILHHHERYDGTGYPMKLKGEDIPVISRMLLIIDSYIAMKNGRKYKEPMSKEAIIKEFNKNKGTQFDGRLIEIFIKLI